MQLSHNILKSEIFNDKKSLEGVHEKPIKRGLGQFANLGGGGAWQEKGHGVLRGGLIPQYTL